MVDPHQALLAVERRGPAQLVSHSLRFSMRSALSRDSNPRAMRLLSTLVALLNTVATGKPIGHGQVLHGDLAGAYERRLHEPTSSRIRR